MTAVLRYLTDLTHFAAEDVLVIREENSELYSEFFKETKYPRRCYAISRNVTEEEVFPILKHIKYLLAKDDILLTISVNNIPSSDFEFFANWEELIDRINHGNIYTSDLEKIFNNLHKHLPGFLTNSASILENLIEYINHFIVPLYAAGPYLNTSHLSQKQLWYHDVEQHSTLLRKYLRVIDSQSSLYYFLAEVVRPIIGQHLKKLLKYNQLSSCEKLYMMSSYFGALAEHHFMLNQYNISAIYTHRALDLFFLQLAYDHKLVAETGGFLQYVNPVNGKSEVSITRSLKSLIQNSVLLSDKLRDDFIYNLNNNRNLSMLAHGVYSFTKSDAAQTISKSRSIIKLIEGNSRWEKAVDGFKPTPKIGYDIIFESIPSLDTYYKQI